MIYINVEAFAAEMRARADEEEDMLKSTAYRLTARNAEEYAEVNGLTEQMAAERASKFKVIEWI